MNIEIQRSSGKLTNPQLDVSNPQLDHRTLHFIHRVGESTAVVQFSSSDVLEGLLHAYAAQSAKATNFQPEIDLSLDDAVPINFNLICAHQGFSEVVSSLLTVMKLDTPIRGCDVPKYLHHLKVLLSNLLDGNWRRLSKNKNNYRRAKRYQGRIAIGYKTALRVVEWLSGIGVIEEKVGFYCRDSPESSRQSRIRLSAAPRSAWGDAIAHWLQKNEYVAGDEPLILKDSTKNLIEYSDNTRTIEMRGQLKRFQKMLHDHDVVTGPNRLQGLSIRRVFNNSDFEIGGRFYGDWQRLPQQERAKITINSDPTVELDYRGLHLGMLYHKEKIQIDNDPYELDGLSCDLPYLRRVVKSIMLVMINAEGPSVKRAITYRLAKDGIYWLYKEHIDEIILALKEKHAPVAKYFGSGIGIQLQFMDSLLTEQIMEYFTVRGILVLPVHDSYIIAERYEDDLRSLMMDVYLKDFGFSPVVERK